MKYALIVGVASLLMASISQAQLTGTLNQVVSPVRPIIDRTPSDLKAIREEAKRRVQSSIEGVDSATTLVSSVVNSIPSPQFVAPETATILSSSGQVIVNKLWLKMVFLLSKMNGFF